MKKEGTTMGFLGRGSHSGIERVPTALKDGESRSCREGLARGDRPPWRVHGRPTRQGRGTGVLGGEVGCHGEDEEKCERRFHEP